ncbi:efflux RND transporter permease subunit [Mariniblastus fucicola]|uniref:efflux RND transporter permease subunit n=1 Tax=Mariniblastus fucicola TaxID=980251 RepID=UPI00138FA6DA|nr:efflux RND transporter permease subunit [Mariniblastus fucicola]
MLAAITAVSCIGHFSPDAFWSLFREAEPTPEVVTESDFESRPNVESFQFSSHGILVAQSEDFFTSEGVAAMRAVVKALEDEPFIDGVTWMEDIPGLNLFGLPEPVFPKRTASEELYRKAKRKALENPFVRGQLLSEDANTMVLLFNYDFFMLEDDQQCIAGVREIAQTASEQFDVEIEFGVTGPFPIYLSMMEQHEANNFFYQMVGYSVIFVMSLILFRGLVAVLVLGAAPALGVFWTLGFVSFLGYDNNPFIDVVLPILVSLVGLTDGVHLLVQIRKLRASGLKPLAAAREGLSQVGLACGLTSLTTAIGFGSLALARHEFVQQFGYSCVIGVICCFVAVITVIPLACSTWIGNFIQSAEKTSLIDRNLDRISGVIDFVLPRKLLFSLIAIAATILLILVSTTLRPDERLSSAMPASSEPAIALAKLDDAMQGLEQGYVRILWDREIEADAPEVMQVVKQVDTLLAKEPLLGNVVSIRHLIDALPGEGPPETRMSMLELLLPPFKRVYYEPESRYTAVNFRVRDLGISQYNPVFTRMIAGMAEIENQHPHFTLYAGGKAFNRWENLYKIVVDLALSLGTASLIIFAILAIVYRSLRIGLISFVPNLFPLAFAGAFLVVTSQSLEVVAVCAFTVCLGIAVDDTIHFLTRFEEERKICDADDEAIRKAFTGVGTALIMTTVVLVSGFATVLMSDSRDHFIFASMGAITIAAALFADLVFLPALLSQFARKKPE